MTKHYHDNHNHTALFSPDAKQSLDELIEDALARGLGGLTLTDHYDKDMIEGEPIPGLTAYGDPKNSHEWVFDFAEYRDVLMAKQVELVDRRIPFKLLRGVEIGYVPYQTPELWPFMAGTDFDSLILSVHCVDGKDIYYHRDAYANGYKAAYQRYLEHIVDMLEQKLDFDIVGHFDYVTRYVEGKHQPILYREFPDHFDKLFRLMLEQGKTFELNTRSRYRKIDAEQTDIGLQDIDIFRRFRELGGEYLALSSDSHEAGNCGRGFDEAAAMLHRVGLRYLCYFESRKAIVTKLEI